MTRSPNSPRTFPPLPSETVLARAGTDLSTLASTGELSEAFGLEETIAHIVRALMRSDKASVVLLGPAGVGKSACVEELCRLQASGRLPEPVASQRIVQISFQEVAGLQPPGRDQNDYFHYLRTLLEEVQEYNVILFLDEVQSLAYWPVTAQTIKPLLARGKLRVIAATTPAEYDQFIGRDPALDRRFQVVQLSEPGEEQLSRIIRGAAPRLETRFGVTIGDEAINECIRMSRYLPQQQPDASLDLLELAAIEAAGVDILAGGEHDNRGTGTHSRSERKNGTSRGR